MFEVKAWACALGLAVSAGAALPQAAAPVTATDPPPAEAFYRRPDVVHAELSPSGHWLAVLSTLGGDRSALIAFDVQETMRHADGMVVLVESFSDREPGEYLIYRADKKQWRSIVRQRNDIDPRRMGLRDLYRVKARDGLEIPVWVTTPPGPARPRRRHDRPWCWCTAGPGCVAANGGGARTHRSWHPAVIS